MNIKRLLTTIIGIPLVVLILIFGDKYVIGIVTLILSILSMYEYFKAIKKVVKPIQWVGYLSNIFIIFAMFFDFQKVANLIVFSIPIIILALFLQVIVTNMKTTLRDVSYTLLGILYIPFFLMFLELTRILDNGKIFIGYVLIIPWATDILAYLIGKNFGKHKFSKVSPNKTIEGLIAGTLGALIITLIYTYFINRYVGLEYSYLILGIIGVALSLICQIGDFTASVIKRFVDIKDYGNLIPGHGGVLDRIDSILFVLPFAYLAFMLI